MSSRLRAFARLVTAVTVVMVYVALQLAVSAGMDLRAAVRFHQAPARAAAFTAALNRYSGGDASARAELAQDDAWFAKHAPSGGSRSTVSAAAADADQGRVGSARQRVAGLAEQVARDQAGLDRRLDSSGATALSWAAPAAALLVPALWLRRRRRSGAAEVVALVSRFAPRQPRWRRPLFLAASGVGSTFFTAGFFAVTTAQRQGYKMPPEAMVLLLVGGLLALGAGILILRYTRPRSARGAAQALLADGRQPVLFLRSFADDGTGAQVDDMAAVNIHSREEQLAAVLGAVGPVIAVGDPEEPLPLLGAARFYLPRDDWQPTVLRLMELSQLIVLRLGFGEGLWWEVERARATQPARKLILLVPGGVPGLAERLDEQLATLSRLAWVTLRDGWISAVITFDPEWTPVVHPVEAVAGTARGVLARAWSRVKRASLAMTPYTPIYFVGRTLQAALASVGVRKRRMAWRAAFATQTSLWTGFALVTALALLLWLAYRTLQLLGLA
ncbi:transferase [Kitasatospora acidiphila]|uniref:Transferase n=1 Tax=Kitasatospora acidiphila TaxID=2567942 RepID=A0A540W041_9ACTN|nr:transferase [Kitasatospora acidiphila]TQF02357.1 transferase [Kitasatospora acidiphila]